jgi:ATP-dependent Lhr-like helicase
MNGGESRATTPVRTTPITLIARRHAALWASLSAQEDGVQSSHRAQLVLDHIRAHGASFFAELVDGTGLLRSQVEEALGELVALGLVSSDSFGGLRALLVPSGERRSIAGAHRRRRTAKFGMEEAGRWALVRRPRPAKSGARADAGAVPQNIAQQATDQQAVEHVARTLLLRYGVVFWRLIEREAAWLPPWRDLLRVYRRLESRGDIRGGRFVAGFSGEQFALPDAVASLREVRRQPASGALVSLSGADPLNLAGIITPGPRLAALTGNRLLYRDGVPIALLAAGEVQFLETLDAASEWAAQKALLRSADPGPPIAPAAPPRFPLVPNASRF